MKPENRVTTSPAEMLREEFGINDVESITAENVVDVARRTGSSTAFWLNLQRNYDDSRSPEKE